MLLPGEATDMRQVQRDFFIRRQFRGERFLLLMGASVLFLGCLGRYDTERPL